MNAMFLSFAAVAPGHGRVLVEGAGVVLVDVIALVPGLGDVLAPDPGPATVLVPNRGSVPIPRIGTDLVPIPKNATETRASLAVAAAPGLLIVLVPDLDLAPVVGHVREKETIQITWTSPRRMVMMTGGPARGPLLPKRAPRRMRICTLAAPHRPRMMVLMNDEMEPNSYTEKFNCILLLLRHTFCCTHSYTAIYMY